MHLQEFPRFCMSMSPGLQVQNMNLRENRPFSNHRFSGIQHVTGIVFEVKWLDPAFGVTKATFGSQNGGAPNLVSKDAKG